MKNSSNISATYNHEYLDKMPIAIAVIKVIAIGNNADYFFEYANDAFALLEKKNKNDIIGHRFCDVLPKHAIQWQQRFHDVAYMGKEIDIIEESDYTGKCLSVTCYQACVGSCVCMVKDIGNQILLKRTIEKTRRKTDLILKNSVDVVFDIDLKNNMIVFDKNAVEMFETVPVIYDIPYGLVEGGFLKSNDLCHVTEIVRKIKGGTQKISFQILARLNMAKNFKWYRTTLSSYTDPFTNSLCIVGFMKDIDKEVQHKIQLQKKAEIDGLTQIYNSFTGKLKIKKYISDFSGSMNAMFIIDVDNFKNINDSYGHVNGDKALVRVANALSLSFRRDDIIFRLGGDEFAVFIKNNLEEEQINRICQNIFTEIFDKFNKKYQITVSIGVAKTKPGTIASYDKFYENADHALYQVKNNGKNNFCINYF